MVILSPVPSLLTKAIHQLQPKEKSAQELKRDGVLQGVGSPLLLVQTGAIHHSEVSFCAVLGGGKV